MAEEHGAAENDSPKVDERGRVRIINTIDGGTGTVPLEKLESAKRSGWRPESSKERAERLSGGTWGSLGRGAAIGAMDMAMAPTKLATFLGAKALGTEDPLADVSGRVGLERLGYTREELDASHHEHGTAMKVGELAAAGAVGAGMMPVLSPVGNLVGKGLGLGAEAAGAAAGTAHKVAHIGGEIATGIFEGAAMGASGASEEAWLKNEKLTMEHATSSIVNYALWGGGTVAGFKAAGAALGAGKSALAKFIKREAPEVADAAVAPLERGARGLFGDVADAAGPGILEKRAKPGMLEKAREFATGMSDEFAVKAVFRGDQSALKKIGIGATKRDSARKLKELGQLLNESGIVGGSDSAMLERARALADAMGPKIGAAVKRVDEMGIKPDASGWLSKVTEISKKLREQGATPEADSVADFIERQSSIIRKEAEAGTITFDRLRQFRLAVDESINFGKAVPKLIDRAKRDLRSITEREIEDGVGKAAASGEASLLSEYLKAKKLFGVAMDATGPLAKRVERAANANMALGLTGNVLAAGGIAGAALGHPVSLVAPFAGKVLRERGWSTAAVLARKIAGTAVDVTAAPAEATGLARALNAYVADGEHRVMKSITGFLSAKEEAAVGGLIKTAFQKAPTHTVAERLQIATGDVLREHYAHHATEVGHLAASQEIAQDRLEKAIGTNVARFAPKLQMAIASQSGKVAQYLQSHLPGPAHDPNSITPHVAGRVPVSDGDIKRYAQRLEGATDPLSILADMERGHVSPEKIDAVRVLWPELHESLRRNVIASLQERTEPVPYAKRVILDRVLDARGAIEPSRRPTSRAAMDQAAQYVQQQAAARRQPSPSPNNPLAASMRPRTESLAMK